MKNNIYSVIGMGLLFVIVQIIALAIAPIYSEAEAEALGGKETIENPSFAFLYLGIILLVTFVILIIAKRKKEKFIKILILAAIFMTMVYLFIPLTIAVMYPPSDDGWGYNEIGFSVTALNAADVDDDGIIEVVAGCSDHKIRVYESENHTLEWESEELDANITQILIGNYDADDSTEIVLFTGAVTVYDGFNQSMEYSSTRDDIPVITGADLNRDSINELIIGTQDTGSVEVLELYSPSIDINLSSSLVSIEFLDATDDGWIVAADSSTITLINSTTHEIELEISELEEIRALTVYNHPNGEDYIITVDDERPYLFNVSSSDHVRKGPKFEDIKALHLEHYSIPNRNDSIPDVIAVGEKTEDGETNIYISPDLLKSEKEYYYLIFKYNVYSFLSTDLEEDGNKEIILGTEDGYRYTTITFGGGPNLMLPFVISIILASLLTILVHKFPEWYVVDG
ncbi:MAG: hypothetical protein JSV09_13820, partial [Thermoplasmata archaeon]